MQRNRPDRRMEKFHHSVPCTKLNLWPELKLECRAPNDRRVLLGCPQLHEPGTVS